MKRFITLIIALSAFGQIKAQEIWTLEKCIEYALTNNIQVKQQMLQVESTKAEVLQNKLTLLPSMNGFASHGYNWGKTVDRYTNAFATKRVQSNNFYLQSSITLFDGFQKVNQLKMSQSNLEAIHFDTDKFMDDISLNIATAYLQILFYQEALKTAQNQLRATELQAARLKMLVEGGALAQGDYFNIEAQKASESTAVVDAQNNLDLANLTLEQMLDIPASNNFQVETPDLELGAQPALAANVEQVYGYALEVQPSIKSARSKVHSSELGLSMAEGGQSPSLTLSGSVGTGYSGAAQVLDNYTLYTPEQTVAKTQPSSFFLNPDGTPQYVWSFAGDVVYKTKPFKDQINDNINKSIALNLSVPIFNGWSTHTAISKAKINVINSRYNLDLSKLQLRKTIEQSVADARAALNKYQSSITGVDAARESYRYADQKFTLGSMNSVDYNNSKKDLEKAESNLLQAKFEFIFKSTVLDFYMGKPISLKRK